MKNVTVCYLGEDNWLTQLVVQVLTRNKQFVSKSMARRLITQGAVVVDGVPIIKCEAILPPSTYDIRVGPSVYRVQVEHSAKE